MATPDDVVVLRQERNQAIADFEFPKAKLIDLQLKRLADQQSGDDAAQRRLHSQLEYDKVKEWVRSEAQRSHASAVETMFQVETEWQTRLTTLQNSQTKQLAAHAESLAAELELAAIRGVPDSITLRKEAQAVAKLGDFDAAESLFAQANSEHQKTIVQRQSEIREIYDRLLVQLEAKHADELKLHNDKRIVKLRDVRAKYARKIENLKQQLANSAFRFAVARDEHEDDEIFEELADPEAALTATRPRSTSRSSSAGSSPRNRPPSRSSGSSPKSPKSPKSPSAQLDKSPPTSPET
jgi:hypothetical protein